jgi:hypothetical protein
VETLLLPQQVPQEVKQALVAVELSASLQRLQIVLAVLQHNALDTLNMEITM